MADSVQQNLEPDRPSSGGSTDSRVATLNARIDRLPTWGLSPTLFVVIGLSYLFVYYDITVFGVALPTMLPDLGLPESASAPPLTANLVAYIVGAYGLGTFADYVGRRKAVIASILLIAVGSVLTGISWNLASLTVFRVIAGLGMGAQISLASTLIGEYAPASIRSRCVNRAAAIGPIGLIIPAFLGIALLPFPHTGWRILFALDGLSFLVLILCRKKILPESPRWLMVHGRTDEAATMVEGMEETTRRRTGKPLPPVPAVPDEEEQKGFPTLQLFSRAYLPRLLMVFFYWAIFYIMDYGFVGYEPTLLTKLGVSLPSGLVYAGLAYVGFLVGGVLAWLLADRFERKFLIAASLSVGVIGVLIIAFVHTPAGAIAGGFLAGLGQYGASSTAYAYTAELFPTRARASGMAFGDGLGHVGGAIAPFIVLALLSGAGAEATFVSFAVFLAISLLIILAGTRTKGRSLTGVAR
jgi:putative MFS transporter